MHLTDRQGQLGDAVALQVEGLDAGEAAERVGELPQIVVGQAERPEAVQPPELGKERLRGRLAAEIGLGEVERGNGADLRQAVHDELCAGGAQRVPSEAQLFQRGVVAHQRGDDMGRQLSDRHVGKVDRRHGARASQLIDGECPLVESDANELSMRTDGRGDTLHPLLGNVLLIGRQVQLRDALVSGQRHRELLGGLEIDPRAG